MTTLADMSAEERAEHTGIWCEVAISKALFIYISDAQKDEEMAVVVNPRSQFRTTAQLHVLTPRYDLPRAWIPDGQPPAGEWQTAKVKIIPNENAKYDREQNVITGDAVADPDHEPRSSHDIRRWIGEWEEACPR